MKIHKKDFANRCYLFDRQNILNYQEQELLLIF